MKPLMPLDNPSWTAVSATPFGSAFFAQVVAAGVACKNAGDYPAANAVWAYLWWEYSRDRSLPGVGMALETDWGCFAGEDYYDLAVWTTDSHRLTIPVPLLHASVACAFARDAKAEARGKHGPRDPRALPAASAAVLRRLRWGRVEFARILGRGGDAKKI